MIDYASLFGVPASLVKRTESFGKELNIADQLWEMWEQEINECERIVRFGIAEEM